MATHKKNKNKSALPKERVFVEKDDDTEYGMVVKKLGGSRFMVKLNLQEKEVMARVCGKFRKGGMKKKNMVEIGTIVLVGLRDYQDSIVDIIHVYTPEEARRMKKENTIIFDTTNITPEIGGGGETQEEDMPFEFGDI